VDSIPQGQNKREKKGNPRKTIQGRRTKP